MKRSILVVLAVGIVSYFCLYFYFFTIQTSRFKSTKLPDNYSFKFKEAFEEMDFKAKDNGRINSLLFKSDSSKGVICFWKGNGANLEKWGSIAPKFLALGYDIIITDYREHGKSKGDISMENFYLDAQMIYDFLKTRYQENKIVITGYSLGSSIASHLSATNNPRVTILIEPREKFEDKYLEALFLPLPNINRFPFRTDQDIQKSTSPIIIIAGTKSSLYNDEIRLKGLLTENDSFFEIQGADHGSILGTKDLDEILRRLLTD